MSWSWRTCRYEPFATLDASLTTISRELRLDDSNLLFTRTRTTGRPGYAGKGMGATMVTEDRDPYHVAAEFKHGTPYTYTFAPSQPQLDLSDGELYPTHGAYAARYGEHPRRLQAKHLIDSEMQAALDLVLSNPSRSWTPPLGPAKPRQVQEPSAVVGSVQDERTPPSHLEVAYSAAGHGMEQRTRRLQRQSERRPQGGAQGGPAGPEELVV